MWAVVAPHRKEMENSSSAMEHREFVANAVAEMTKENAVSLFPPGEKPWVVSPLGGGTEEGNGQVPPHG